MLAMMSCIFNLPQVIPNAYYPHSKDSILRRHLIDSVNHSFEHSTREHDWQPWYYPSHEVALSVLYPTQSSWAKEKTAKLSIDPPSVASSFGVSGSDPVTPFSTGKTPPLGYMSARTTSNKSDLTHQILSTSPEQLRNPHRSNSNLASAFAVSFQRPLGIITSASSSPPNFQLKTRDSPGGSYAGVHHQSVTWAATSMFGRSSSITEDPISANTTFDSPTAGQAIDQKDKSIKINLRNQDLFDDETYSSVPLLDQAQELRYRGYRDSYATMLSIWNLPITRTEILQHNSMSFMRRNSTETASMHQDMSTISIGKKTSQIMAVVDSEPSLLLKKTCSECNNTTPLSTTPSRSKCYFCHSKISSPFCVLCDEVIRGRATTCLSCGHIAHAACLSLMVTIADSRKVDGLCISGCDCHCMKDTIVRVGWPSEHIAPASPSPSTIREGEEGGSNSRQRNYSAWEDVAYESLAKNLGIAGAKYVKPKASQIWIGREKRANSVNR